YVQLLPSAKLHAPAFSQYRLPLPLPQRQAHWQYVLPTWNLGFAKVTASDPKSTTTPRIEITPTFTVVFIVSASDQFVKRVPLSLGNIRAVTDSRGIGYKKYKPAPENSHPACSLRLFML